MELHQFYRTREVLARIEVSRLTAAWDGAPSIEVVPTAAALPVKDAPADTVGMFLRGRVFVVAEQPPELLAKTLAHEAIGHAGAQLALGSSWRLFALAVHRAAAKGGDVFLRGLRKRVRAHYIGSDGRPNLRPSRFGDELLAHAAGELFDRRTGRVLVVNPMLAQCEALVGLTARDLGIDYPVDTRQVEGAVLLAERQLRHGDLLLGIPTKAKRVLQWAVTGAAMVLTAIVWLLV